MIQLSHKNDTNMELEFNQLNKRQEKILTILDRKKDVSVSELNFYISEKV